MVVLSRLRGTTGSWGRITKEGEPSMGSRLRQLRLPIVALGLAVAACAATLVSSAFGSTFPGTNGKLVYVTYSAGADKLYTVNADGSGAHRITKPPANQQGDSQPRFSADGKKIVFTRNPNKAAWYQLQLWIANADGTAAHQITIKGLPSGAFPDSPTFTPDGKSIYFVADTINSPVGIWKVSVDGGTATQVTSGDDYTPTVSPDGKKIAYGHNLTLVIANADGSHPHTLYTEAGTITSIGQPDFSPDGTTIAFMAYNSSTAASDIFTIPAAGGSPTNLTHGTVYSYGDPSYS